jgi:LysM repeat protein
MLLKTMMNFRFLILITLLSTLSTSLFAHNIVFDSIGVENQNGKKIILHKLDPKDNFYSVGRRYNISPKLIIDYNKGASMGIGEVIKVPTNIPFGDQSAAAKPAPAQQSKPVTQVPVYTAPVQHPVIQSQPSQTSATTTQYKVSAGETLYAIAKRFNTTVEDITSLNSLKSTILTPGQIILVRATPPPAEKPVVTTPAPVVAAPVMQHPVPQPITAKRDSTIVSASDSLDSTGHRILRNNNYGLYEKNEKGVALWIEDADLDPNKKLILHRTAPIGTVIKITNPMTNRTTFAKVVGRINDNDSNKDAIVVMTKSVADALGTLDKRFHVNLSYGSPNE